MKSVVLPRYSPPASGRTFDICYYKRGNAKDIITTSTVITASPSPSGLASTPPSAIANGFYCTIANDVTHHHLMAEPNGFVHVDLGGSQEVRYVIVSRRVNLVFYDNAKVYVGDSLTDYSANIQLTNVKEDGLYDSTYESPGVATGRYVIIYSQSSVKFDIGEIQVITP